MGSIYNKTRRLILLFKIQISYPSMGEPNRKLILKHWRTLSHITTMTNQRIKSNRALTRYSKNCKSITKVDVN